MWLKGIIFVRRFRKGIVCTMCKLGGGGYFKYKISKGAYSNMIIICMVYGIVTISWVVMVLDIATCKATDISFSMRVIHCDYSHYIS